METTKTTRMRLTDLDGAVLISYTDPYTGEIREREFRVPAAGGYVMEVYDSGERGQVCDGLAGSGSTLMSSPRSLAATIRREYRRMMRTYREEVSR